MWPSKYKYDAFISHAVEDKLPIANELCLRLEKEGLKIWYSGKELVVGDSLERAIHKSLAQSRYGVVILSPTYLQKNWPIKEFYMLLAKEIEQQKVILPVLYQITMEELKEKDMVMADKWGIPFDKGMDHIVSELIETIKGRKVAKNDFWAQVKENYLALNYWFFFVLAIMLIVVIIYWGYASYINRRHPKR